MLRSLVFMLLSAAPNAFTSQNLNHLSCIFMHDSSGWFLFNIQTSSTVFNLENGELRTLVEGWTSHRPAPNSAVCTRMQGTDSDDQVNLETLLYRADELMPGSTECAPTGKNVRLVSDRFSPLGRGSYVDLESEWLLPPSPDKILVRTYFPLQNELSRLNEIANQKCTDLIPKSIGAIF